LVYISRSVKLHTGKSCQKQSERAGCTVTKNGSASWGGIFDVDGKRRELQAREARMGEQGFWDDPERAREVIAEIKKLKEIVEPFDTLSTKVHELLEMDALIEQEPDDALSAEIEREVSSLDEQVPAFEVRSLLPDPTAAAARCSRSVPARGERKRRTGRPCSCACTSGGRRVTGSSGTCWT